MMMDKRESGSWAGRQGGLLQPDVVLPVQFFRTLRGGEPLGGERRLILAVLEDAINCFQKNLFARDNRGRRLFREAEKWVMSSDRELPFAFENVCDFLSLDANCIRQGLRRWALTAASQAVHDFGPGAGHARRAAAAPLVGPAARAGMALVPARARTSFARPHNSAAV